MNRYRTQRNSSTDAPTTTVGVDVRWLLVVVSTLCALPLAGCTPWRTSSPVCLAGARLPGSGECKPQRAPVHRMPFRDGYQTKVMQAYHGYRTHKKDLAFSVDYKCDVGTPIVASRGGIVWATREDSNRGCDDPSCVDDGNYVVIDHGDGTFSEYHHLQQFGALVEVGDQVCRGELIGMCGNTGYSTGPHLHFAVTDVTHRTVPSRLAGAGKGTYPFPVPERSYRSTNERRSTCRSTDFSTIPTDAFAHHGILLDRQLPIVIRRDETVSKLSGRYYGDHPQIAVHRKEGKNGKWVDECVPVDDKGRFEASLHWPSSKIGEGFHWFMITGADENCLSPGWAWSYKLRVE